MPGFQDLYKLLPSKNCSVCGNPSCATMARRIVLGIQDPSECINLTQDRLELIRKLAREIQPEDRLESIREWLALRIEPGPSSQSIQHHSGVVFIHPCTSESGKLAAELRPFGIHRSPKLIHGFLDPDMICYLLDFLDFPCKCSTKLGIASLEIHGSTAIIYSSGRITLRRAQDRQDALRILEMLNRATWGAIICSCGNPGVDCASGGCEQCSREMCQVLEIPSAQHPSTESIFTRAAHLMNSGILLESFRKLEEAHSKILLGMDRGLEPIQIWEEIRSASKSALEFMLGAPTIQDGLPGLVLIGIGLDLHRISQGLNSIRDLNPELLGLLEQIREIISGGFQAFKHSDSARKLIQIYPEINRKLIGILSKQHDSRMRDSLLGMAKAAANGFYIARVACRFDRSS